MANKGLSKFMWLALGMLILLIVFGILLTVQKYTQRAIEPTLESGAGSDISFSGYENIHEQSFSETYDTVGRNSLEMG